MEYLVYLVYPIIIALFAVGCKVARKGEWNEEFMSLQQTKYLQGFTAILIMLHHVGQKTCAHWLEPRIIRHGLDLFVPYGYYFVGIFLFCSGYGLYKSFMAKENYLKGFLKKRALPLIVAFYSAGFVFLIVRFLMKQPISTPMLLLYIIGFAMPNPNSWYVIAAPFFYLVFYLCFRFIKDEKKATLATCAGIFLYTIAGTLVRHNDFWMCGEWWYNSAHFFSLGLLFARSEKKIIEGAKKHYRIYVVVGFILIFLLDMVAKYGENVFSFYYGEYSPAPYFQMIWRKWVTLLGEVLASCAFVFWVFLVTMKVKIGNKVLKFFGNMTLEFYLIHGLFVELFGYSFCGMRTSLYNIKNVALYTLVVFVLGTVSAVVFHGWMNFILGNGKKKKEV